MTALVGLIAFVALIEIVAIRGWGHDSRDGRDWTSASPSRGAHGAVHMPRAWWKSGGTRPQ